MLKAGNKLKRRGGGGGYNYVLSNGGEVEDIKHLFFPYPFSRTIWWKCKGGVHSCAD